MNNVAKKPAESTRRLRVPRGPTAPAAALYDFAERVTDDVDDLFTAIVVMLDNLQLRDPARAAEAHDAIAGLRHTAAYMRLQAAEHEAFDEAEARKAAAKKARKPVDVPAAVTG